MLPRLAPPGHAVVNISPKYARCTRCVINSNEAIQGAAITVRHACIACFDARMMFLCIDVFGARGPERGNKFQTCTLPEILIISCKFVSIVI